MTFRFLHPPPVAYSIVPIQHLSCFIGKKLLKKSAERTNRNSFHVHEQILNSYKIGYTINAVSLKEFTVAGRILNSTFLDGLVGPLPRHFPY
jgi:hypothetical protein